MEAVQISSRPAFVPFPSISRLSRDMIVTEKLDGTNAQVYVTEDGQVFAASRTRWITPEDDNFGFAAWVAENAETLKLLGPGQHFGEWWGRGIQRGYGLNERRFSLFNVSRWHSLANETFDSHEWLRTECLEVPCCHVVPIMLHVEFDTASVDEALDALREQGSYAVPGFMQPEGVVVYHAKSGQLFKKTLDKNDGHKGVTRG